MRDRAQFDRADSAIVLLCVFDALLIGGLEDGWHLPRARACASLSGVQHHDALVEFGLPLHQDGRLLAETSKSHQKQSKFSKTFRMLLMVSDGF